MGKSAPLNIQVGLSKCGYALLGWLALSCSIGCMPMFAQNSTHATAVANTDSTSTDSVKVVRRTTRVDLLHADRGIADSKRYPDAQVLIGNVQFKHKQMYMYCDSALIYQKSNSFEAFSNVRCEQGDTLFIYSDYLYYDGEIELAKLRNHVRMINRNTVLTTDSLNYDRVYNLGYYFEGGRLSDEENNLSSDWGEYSPATKWAVFNDDVVLLNKQFQLYSDTLKYNSETKEAVILGPSTINNQQNHIYSNRGVYHTSSGQAELLDRSVLVNGSKRVTGDSLFYDRIRGYAELYNNVEMKDTLQKNILRGDYIFYNEILQSAFATKKAEIVEYSQGDSLHLHADTLQLSTFNHGTDSIERQIYAYHKVRFYRTDLQGVCDSLTFLSKDSCLTLYNNPVLWSGQQQLYGEQVQIFMNDSTVDHMVIPSQAFSIERLDSVHYNQVSGQEMKAFMRDGELRKVEVTGNVRVVYYPQENKNKAFMGMNYSESSKLQMFLKNQQMERMIMSPQANGTLYPMDQIPAEKYRLTNFAWMDYLRPRAAKDIFEWVDKKASDKLKKTSRKKPDNPDRSLVIENGVSIAE
ncbi:MAG TPA: OstA-like protein [Bacteroidaceae bacterium]|nr:OstA-like protein [Bacteroidaceae bacterium]